MAHPLGTSRQLHLSAPSFANVVSSEEPDGKAVLESVDSQHEIPGRGSWTRYARSNTLSPFWIRTSSSLSWSSSPFFSSVSSCGIIAGTPTSTSSAATCTKDDGASSSVFCGAAGYSGAASIKSAFASVYIEI